MSERELETIIGLEVHVQLDTKSKLFCSCSNESEDAAPNTNICDLCLGSLGSLPLLNKRAVEFMLAYGKATNCEIVEHSKWDRKNYFYPDLPKGYQISQYDLPLASAGHLELTRPDGSTFTVRINRIHLEEDAAKTVHKGDKTLVDFNRSGTPLAELVTEPDLRSVEDAKIFLQELRRIVRYIGVSRADMEKGHLRCDASISLRPKGEDKLYPRTEVKNINSFRNVERALAFEIKKQQRAWEQGKANEGDTTALWDDAKQETRPMRDKEGAADYRYFPEPDIPEVEIKDANLDVPEVPELPQARLTRYMNAGLKHAEALALIETREVSDYFDQATSDTSPELYKEIAKWFLGEAFALLKDGHISEMAMTPESLRDFASAVHKGLIARVKAKELFPALYEGKLDLDAEIKKSEEAKSSIDLPGLAKKVLDEHPEIVEQYKAGKEQAINVVIGKVIKETNGALSAPEIAKAVKDLI